MKHTYTGNIWYETVKRTTFIKWVFPNQSKDLQKDKDQKRSRSISQMKLRIAQQTPAPLSQTPASSKAKVQWRQKKAKITVLVSCMLLITYCGAKPPSHQEKKKVYTHMPLYLSLHDRSLIRHFHPSTQDTRYLPRFTGDLQRLHFLAFPQSWQFVRDTSADNGLPWCCGVLRAVAPVPARSLLSTWGVSCLPSFCLISKEAQSALFPTLQPSKGKWEKELSVQDRTRLYLAQFDPMLHNSGNKLLPPLGVGKKSTCPIVPDPAISKPTNPLLNYLSPPKQLF